MNILGTVLSYIYSNFNPFNYIPQNFNPVDTKFIKGNDVAYGLGYQDKDDGTSEVKLLISPSYQLDTYEWDTGISVPSEFKNQLSLKLIKDTVETGKEDLAETDKIAIISSTDKGLSLNIYEVKLPGAILVELLSTTKLQKNKENNNLANSGNRYSNPQVVTLDNGDVVVIAKNLKDKTLVSWYLKSENGKFEALAGSNGITERKLLQLSNTGNQFVLNGNTLLYSQDPLRNNVKQVADKIW
ncbi:hypothetical protein [Wolbachia endosymbiont (group E) of Neria commutata]|uniref:hypothetical protein n=1 Tax=Wolbachia endosymbiont (group E) of Neria commutata TaxID=3066149 RepID=UPI0031334889